MTKNIIFFAAFLLLMSFGLHTFQVHHDHPKFLGEGITAILHGEDKKWWAMLSAFSALLLGALVLFTLDEFFVGAAVLQNTDENLNFSNFLKQALSRGRLQPKLCH